jgi:hypothetical protein
MKKEHDLDSTEFSIKFGDSVMLLREPTLMEQLRFEKGISELESKPVEEMYDFYKGYLVALGGDDKLIEKLSMNQFMSVLEIVQGKKK